MIIWKVHLRICAITTDDLLAIIFLDWWCISQADDCSKNANNFDSMMTDSVGHMFLVYTFSVRLRRNSRESSFKHFCTVFNAKTETGMLLLDIPNSDVAFNQMGTRFWSGVGKTWPGVSLRHESSRKGLRSGVSSSQPDSSVWSSICVPPELIDIRRELKRRSDSSYSSTWCGLCGNGTVSYCPFACVRPFPKPWKYFSYFQTRICNPLNHARQN